jgi:hypothetical protein
VNLPLTANEGAPWWRFGPLSLLPRNLYALGAFIAVEEIREIFGLAGADHDPGVHPIAC